MYHVQFFRSHCCAPCIHYGHKTTTGNLPGIRARRGVFNACETQLERSWTFSMDRNTIWPHNPEEGGMEREQEVWLRYWTSAGVVGGVSGIKR